MLLKELKDLIKDRRVKIGKTMEQIGLEVGVSKATVQRWESGEIKDMRRDKLVTLARALNTTPAYLMGWDTEGKTLDQIAQEDAAILDAYQKAPPEIQEAIQRILKR